MATRSTTPTGIKPHLIVVSTEATRVNQSTPLGYDTFATAWVRFSRMSAPPEISGVRLSHCMG